ncbi:MAG: PIN domain-containing protein [Pseudomonadota bacterium]
MTTLPAAVLDANVLAPLIKRRVLMVLAEAKLFRPVISDSILAEARHALKHLPTDSAAHGARDLDELERAWQVHIIPPAGGDSPPLKDENDRHVVGAAIAASASLIVTENIRDFPKKALSPFGLSTMTADRFVCGILEGKQKQTRAALLSLPERLQADFLTPETLLPILRRSGFRRVVKALSEGPPQA